MAQDAAWPHFFGCSAQALTGLWFEGEKDIPCAALQWPDTPTQPILDVARCWVQACFSGRRADIQKLCWRAVLRLVGSSGALTGYADWLVRKQRQLALEGVSASAHSIFPIVR